MQTVENMKTNHAEGVVVVRPAGETMSRQRLPYFVGISAATAGAKDLSMNLIIIPPAGSADPHLLRGMKPQFICSRAKSIPGMAISWKSRLSAKKAISS